jgi:hypothetical protein
MYNYMYAHDYSTYCVVVNTKTLKEENAFSIFPFLVIDDNTMISIDI